MSIRINAKGLAGVALGSAIACGGSVALGQSFFDGFEDYAPGTVLNHVGGWWGWNDVPAAAAVVSDDQAFSGTNSVLVTAGTDAVHPFTGKFTSGQFTVTAQTWVDSSRFDQSAYFILNNEYVDNGAQEWIIQTYWSATTDMVEDLQRPNTDTPQPIVYDQWVELRIEIDLDGDTQTTFYNGAEVSTGQLLTRGGPAEIANIDLYSEGGTMYFDDITIEPAGGGGLSLALSGTCPGQVTAAVSGATPGGNVAFIRGFATGSCAIPPGNPCAGTEIGLSCSGAALLGLDQADDQGNASLSGNAPAGACGRVFVQAVDLSTCSTSNVEQLQ